MCSQERDGLSSLTSGGYCDLTLLYNTVNLKWTHLNSTLIRAPLAPSPAGCSAYGRGISFAEGPYQMYNFGVAPEIAWNFCRMLEALLPITNNITTLIRGESMIFLDTEENCLLIAVIRFSTYQIPPPSAKINTDAGVGFHNARLRKLRAIFSIQGMLN